MKLESAPSGALFFVRKRCRMMVRKFILRIVIPSGARSAESRNPLQVSLIPQRVC